jgi:hypothetical protein
MYLDAVPLTTNDVLRDDNNIELKKMLEKYLFEDSITVYKGQSVGMSVSPELIKTLTESTPKKRGRPSKKK